MSILVAGNYCHDALLSNAGERRALGGSSAYAASVLLALGEAHEIVAKVGEDFLYGREVLRPPRVEGPRTTSFVDDYRGGGRIQRVSAAGPPIRPGDLGGSFRIGLACGIAGEVGLDLLARMRDLCALLMADAQSLLREVGPGGDVRPRPLPPGAAAMLDVLKTDEQEARLLDLAALRRRTIVLLTQGKSGCLVLTPDAELRIPPFEAAERDPTGAGDCFLAGFAAGRRRGFSLAQAARLGAFCGARAVEVEGIPRPEEIGRGLPQGF